MEIDEILPRFSMQYIQGNSKFLKQSSNLSDRESSSSVRNFVRTNRHPIGMVLLLLFLILPWHSSVKSLGAVSSTAKLKVNGYHTHLISSSHISTTRKHIPRQPSHHYCSKGSHHWEDSSEHQESMSTCYQQRFQVNGGYLEYVL